MNKSTGFSKLYKDIIYIVKCTLFWTALTAPLASAFVGISLALCITLLLSFCMNVYLERERFSI